ncbi:helix-turn-helix domain-containing protein [Nocardia uniformis]|uniref:Helix-turn-helix domain-containing protein n=1 Tax=Nocardia uniformis TaxID=53432 RepID=A0A849BXK0_9NOCA|nr:helix-turn-helix domain-containing protein [Nocardia uniformis]NNH71004.1 helix-turn-helix domain-containing protein [Nocardia uniformis]
MFNDDGEPFGTQWQRLRKEKRLTQERLAELMRCDVGYISQIENGHRLPSKDFAERADTALDANGGLFAAWAVEGCPFPGLRPFSRRESRWFQGRAQAAEVLFGLIRSRAENGGGSVLLTGDSGAGKSSLLAAGLEPLLRKRSLIRGVRKGTPSVAFTPTSDPMAALQAARVATADIAGPVVWIIDQLEELFTATDDVRVHEEFLDEITRPTTRQGHPVVVVLGVRQDYYSRCMAHPDIRAAVTTGHLALGPMTADEVRHAIEQPAQDAGIVFETGLVDVLLNDLGLDLTRSTATYDPVRLPLLAHTLRQLWLRATDNLLTLTDYQELKGLAGSVATTAEGAWDRFTATEQAAAKPMLLALVHLEENADPARRSAPREQLLAATGDTEVGARLLDAFTDWQVRLLAATDDGITFSHEAVLREWPRLAGWITDDREDILTHRRLTTAAQQWHRDNKSVDALLSAGRTEEFQRWVEHSHHHTPIGAAEREFLDASVEYHAQLTQQERQRQEHLRIVAEKLASQHRRLKKLVVALTLVGVVLIAATLFALDAKRNEADQFRRSHAHEQATISYIVRSGEPEVGGLLAVQAFRANPDVQTRSALLNTQVDRFLGRIVASDLPLYGVAYSPDGTLIAASGYDQFVRLWDARDRRELAAWTTGTKGGSAVTFSRDSRRVANAHDGTLRIWSTTGTEPVVERHGLKSGMSNLAFSPDGTILAALAQHTKEGPTDVQFFDAVTLDRVPGPRGDIGAGATVVAFSEDTGMFAIAGKDSVQVWRTLDAEPITVDRPPAQHRPIALAMSRDGRILVVSDYSGWVTWFDLGDSGREVRSEKFSSAAWGLDLTPDGTVVAIGLDDHSVQLFDTAAATGPAIASLVGHTNSIHRLTFNTDGTTLLTASSDGTIGTWDTADLGSLHPAAPAAAFAYSRNGRTHAVAAADGSVHLWHSATGYRRQQLPGSPREPTGLAFAADDRFLVHGGADGLRVLDTATSAVLPLGTTAVDALAVSEDTNTVAVAWDTNVVELWDAREWRPLGVLPTADPDPLISLAFGGNTHLAAGSYTNSLTVWDLSGAKPERSDYIRTRSDVTAVAFSPDMRLLAYATAQGRINTHDISTRKPLGAEPDHELAVLHPDAVDQRTAGLRHFARSLTFSPDSQFLSAASDDGIIRLWQTRSDSASQPYAVLTAQGGATTAAVFELTGRHLISVDASGVVRRWNLAVDDAATKACTVAGISDPTRWLDRDTALLDKNSC